MALVSQNSHGMGSAQGARLALAERCMMAVESQDCHGMDSAKGSSLASADRPVFPFLDISRSRIELATLGQIELEFPA